MIPGHDMDHDGKITTKDTALFHEMIDEDANRSGSSKPTRREISYSRKEFWLRLAISFACAEFASRVMDGTLPINLLTVILGIIGIIAAFLLVLDLFGVDL